MTDTYFIISIIAAAAAALVALAWAIWRGKLDGVAEALMHGATTAGQATQARAQQARAQATWLRGSAYGPEALSVALTIGWAWAAQTDEVIRWIFVVGFLCFVAFKAHSVSAAVNAWQSRNWGLFTAVTVLALGSVLTLFGSSIFELVNVSGNEVQSRIESSRPAAALDAEIEQARDKLQSLSGYADAAQAEAEARKIEQAEAQRQARIRELQSQIQAALSDVPNNSNGRPAGKSLSALSNGCSFSYNGHYSGQCEPVRQLRGELESLQGQAGGAGEYGAKYADYIGTKAHLAGLLKQRAELSEKGQGVQSAYRPEDKLLSRLFNVDPETASWAKWIVFALVFDLLSLIARIAAQMLVNAAGGDPRQDLMRKVDAMLTLGIDPTDNLRAAMAGAIGGHQPATTPQYRHGGAVHHHGLAELHGTPDRPEYVLSPEMTATLGGADVLEALRRRVHDVGLQANDSKPMTTKGNDSKAMPQANDLNKANDSKPMTTKGNGLQIIRCESCGAEVKQRTVWQRFCAECSAERRKGVLKAKQAANRKRRKAD